MLFGFISINSDRCGATLTHHAERSSLFFQPGDDAGALHDALEDAEALLEGRGAPYTYADVLEAVWADYRHLAQGDNA